MKITGVFLCGDSGFSLYVAVSTHASVSSRRALHSLRYFSGVKGNEDSSFKLVYPATTANASGGTPIFWAEAGVGALNFTLESYAKNIPTALFFEGCRDICLSED
jgi:hypothetical protein